MEAFSPASLNSKPQAKPKVRLPSFARGYFLAVQTPPARCSCFLLSTIAHQLEARLKLRKLKRTQLFLHCILTGSIWQTWWHFGFVYMSYYTTVRDKTITTLQYGNILQYKGHSQTLLQQTKNSQLFNRILGAILTNLDEFQAPDHMHVFI